MLSGENIVGDQTGVGPGSCQGLWPQKGRPDQKEK